MMSTFLSFFFPGLGAVAALLMGYRTGGIWVGAAIGAMVSFLIFLATGY